MENHHDRAEEFDGKDTVELSPAEAAEIERPRGKPSLIWVLTVIVIALVAVALGTAIVYHARSGRIAKELEKERALKRVHWDR